MKSIHLFFASVMLVVASGCATPRSTTDIAASTLRGTWNFEMDTGRGITLGSMDINRKVAGREC